MGEKKAAPSPPRRRRVLAPLCMRPPGGAHLLPSRPRPARGLGRGLPRPAPVVVKVPVEPARPTPAPAPDSGLGLIPPLPAPLFFFVSRPFSLPLSLLLSQRRYSVAKIDSGQTYERGRPKLGGLADPRLGTIDRAVKCSTDGCGVADSPGYFGHIELAKPVYHIGFLTTIIKVLRCVSYHTSTILLAKVRERERGGGR